MSFNDFHFRRNVKAVRRPHRCEQCGKTIEVGSPAEYAFGEYDGDIYDAYTHIECQAAAKEYADLNDAYGEEWPWFQGMGDQEFDHHAFLLEKHPIVAERLGIKAEESV